MIANFIFLCFVSCGTLGSILLEVGLAVKFVFLMQLLARGCCADSQHPASLLFPAHFHGCCWFPNISADAVSWAFPAQATQLRSNQWGVVLSYFLSLTPSGSLLYPEFSVSAPNKHSVTQANTPFIYTYSHPLLPVSLQVHVLSFVILGVLSDWKHMNNTLIQ